MAPPLAAGRLPPGGGACMVARGYHVLLDAAAYVPSSPLSLTDVPADFVAISFYKMFGYPTGVGALLVRREALALLDRAYFCGGTVQFVSIQNPDLFRRRNGGAAFEDGAPNFLAMPAVCGGLRWLNRVGMSSIQQRVACLTSELLDGFACLGDCVRVYSPANALDRGGIVAFNVYSDSEVLNYEAVEAAARDRGIAVRGGCFCNPGASECAFGLNAAHARDCLHGEFSVARFRACMCGKPVGALRASLGLATSEADIDNLVELVARLTRQ